MESQMHSPVVATGFLRRIALSYRVGLFIVLLVALLTHLPTSFGQFSTDDYLIRAMTSGDAALFKQGFTKADPDKPVWQGMLDGFQFYTPDAGTLAAYREYGNLPWWTADHASMNPFRPLAALTHWIDFQIAPDSFSFQSFHTLLYVLLFAFCAYRLFWRISSASSVVVLATLMVIVDFSHVLNFNWIAARNVFMAGALGCAALERFLAWRQTLSTGALWASLSLFVAGLLTAEATIGLCGYLFAYLLLVERCSLRRLVLLLMPFGLVVVAWRLLYNWLGFGADGIGLYVDPGRSLGEFLESLVTVYPVILASVLLTLDGFMLSFSPAMRLVLGAISAVAVVASLLLIWRATINNRHIQFMVAGSLLAAVPGAALISASSRVGLLVALGFFWVLSVWLHGFAQRQRHWSGRLSVTGILTLHLFLPALAGFLYTSQLLPVQHAGNQQFESVSRALSATASPRLVVVNPHAPSLQFYLPFEWRFLHGQIPAGMDVLAPGLVSFDLTRIDSRTFDLNAPTGLPLDHTRVLRALDGREPGWSSAYSFQMGQDLFASPDTRYYPGFTRQTADLRVTVKEVVEGRPSRLRIEFTGREQPDAMIWQWYDWKTREYRALDVPAIGATRHFAGPFDTQTESLVKLCLNCDE